MKQTKTSSPSYTIETIEGKLSHYRVSYNKYGRKIIVPVIDSRDGLVESLIAHSMIKAANRSKYMNYNRYHQSQKKQDA